MRIRVAWAVLSTLLGLTLPATAQVTVTHDDSIKDEVVEIKSPMKIEVGLGASPNARGVMRPPMNEGTAATISRTFTDSARYRIDKAQAKAVTVRRDYAKDEVIVIASVALATEWMRQDLDLTISLIDRGKEVKRQFWDDLTIGSDTNASARMGAVWASRSKTPQAEWRLPRATWDAMFAEGVAPTVRVVIAIEEEEEE